MAAGHYTIKLDEKQYETLLDALPKGRPPMGPNAKKLEDQWNLRSDLLKVKKEND